MVDETLTFISNLNLSNEILLLFSSCMVLVYFYKLIVESYIFINILEYLFFIGIIYCWSNLFVKIFFT